jgi:hypothetical protein
VLELTRVDHGIFLALISTAALLVLGLLIEFVLAVYSLFAFFDEVFEAHGD